MKPAQQKYLLSWIAIVMTILAATFLLVSSLTEFQNNTLEVLLSFSSWILIIGCCIYIFISASNWILKRQAEENEESDVVQISEKTKESIHKSENEHLDIQGVSKKIVRRVNPDQDPEKWGQQLLKLFVSEIEVMSGVFYFRNKNKHFESLSTYAYPHTTEPYSFHEGEGLTGQAVKNRQVIVFRTIPEDYKAVFSGLGASLPSYLAVVPIVIDDQCIAAVELAGFKWSDEQLEQLFQIIARDLAEKISNSRDSGKTGTEDNMEKENRDAGKNE